MRMGKEQDGRLTYRNCGGWFIVVFRIVMLQVAITPVAHSTTELPPLLEVDSLTPVPSTRSLASTYPPFLDLGEGSLNESVTTTIPGVSEEFNSAPPGTVSTISTSVNAVITSTTECVDNCTKPQLTEGGTTEYVETSEDQSEISTQTKPSTVVFNSTSQPEPTTPLTSQSSFTSTSTPETSTLNSTSTTPRVTDGSTSGVDKSTTTFSTQPSTPATNSPSPTLSITPVPTLSITPYITLPSTLQTTTPVSESTPSSTTQSKASTPSTSTDFIATTMTDVNKSGSVLTTQQWVGIGIAIALALVLLGVAVILLTWLRARHNLSKKPIITVSKMEYAQSTTLEKKTDPQWRKSLTMALQSMNTHIEVPTVTDKEMQAVDNAAFKEDTTDPKTTNQDPLHLTKV
ncbi:uncharacterized protein PB18E9.04c-like [Asterias rubens]|uniref:uncharacterized protein PB18E9.04c-like n=1 Tax=Asterias rubens TaxID=7604 RepID=UPI0014559B84|nr:uncharacterized protein PB18E9.04c-like [Asterias rubens]XP_033640848.1 uncharacterized protein PB18E9.04c-like [Asterias rubens]